MGTVEYIKACNGQFSHQNMCEIVSKYIRLKKGVQIEFPHVMYGLDAQRFLTMFDSALNYFMNGN